MTDAERAWLNKTDAGRAIIGNYDANVKDDKDFAIKQLRRSIERNKDALGAVTAESTENDQTKSDSVQNKPTMDAKSAAKILGMDAALPDKQLRFKMNAWDSHRNERQEFAHKANAAKVILEYRASKASQTVQTEQAETTPEQTTEVKATTAETRKGDAPTVELDAKPVPVEMKGEQKNDVAEKVGSTNAQSNIPTDAGFAAWSTERDGKTPIRYASEEERANARELFDMMVRMGKVDGTTGKSITRWSKVAKRDVTGDEYDGNLPPTDETMLRLQVYMDDKSKDKGSLYENAIRWSKALGTVDEALDNVRKDKFENGETDKHGMETLHVIREGDRVLKFRKPDNSTDGELDKVRMHNALFPDTAYTFKGFAKDKDGRAVPVLEQRYVEFVKGGGDRARRLLTEELRKRFGDAELRGKEIHAGGWMIDDLKDANIGLDKRTGKPAVIDCIIHPLKDVEEKLRWDSDRKNQNGVRWSKVVDRDEVHRLDNDPKGYVEAFASAQIGEDGNLYSPMAKVVRGKATPIAFVRDGKVIPEWQKSDEFSDIAFMKDADDRKLKAGQEKLAKRDKDTGDIAYFFTLRKGKGEGTVDARYNPYWHSVSSPLNDQFTTAYRRNNLVTVKVRIPISDLESGYRADKAKDGVGVHPWKSGDVSNALAEAGRPRRDLMLSQYRQITEIVPDETVSKNIIDFIGDADVAIPVNTMTPGVRELLRGKVKFADPNGNASQQASARRWLEDNGVMWSVNWKEHENWNDIVDKYEKGELKSGQRLTLFSGTPVVLRNIGVPDLPITIRKDVIDKIVGMIPTRSGRKHFVPIDDLRNLQIELDNPIAVFDSETDQNSVVILTRIVDRENNEKAVVSLRIGAKEGSLNVNSITSAYGKDKSSFDIWIANNRLRYINKQARKTSARWLELPGDSVLRTRSVLTEKDFPNELLGIVQYPVAKSQQPMWSKAVVTPDDDSAYMDAVKRGDMETARRMVREAAAKAMPNTKVVDKDGLPLVVYHGTTHGGHTIFNGEKNASYSYSVRGVTFFSSSRDVGESYSTNPKTKFADLPKSLIEKAKSYLDENNVEVRQESDGFHSYLDGHHIANSTGKTKDDSMRKASISVASSMEKDEGSMVYSAFVNISNPLVYDFGGELWKGKRSNDGYYDNSVPLLAKRAMANGYDGLIVRNVEDAANIIGRGVADDYAVFSPSQIKSADITYDDAGKLIPLSERFNPQKDDIRWSKEIASNENGNGNSDADNFKRWFADSKIVNSDGEPLVVYRGASYNPTRQPEGKGVVKPEAYFTADREYASRYGETEPYYLRIERPFDVRNPKDAAVLKSLLPNGYDFATGKSGALDWGEMASFDTEDIKALGYDGIVLDEGGDKHPDGGTKYRGVSFVPLYGGAQVKSATKNNGDYSESPDVRWSKAATESIPQDVRDELRGITQDRINYYREKVGLPPLESKHRTLAEMEREGQGLFANRDLVNTIIDAVSKKTRALSEEETFAIRDLEKETAENYQVKVEEANEAMNRGNKADEIRLRSEADAIRERYDKISKVLHETGSTTARELTKRIRDAATSDETAIVNEIKRLGRKSVPTDVDGKFKDAVKQHLDGATIEELELMSPVF